MPSVFPAAKATVVGRPPFRRSAPVGVGQSLTHRDEPPHDGRRGEADEDVVGVVEVREARRRDELAAAHAPHVHLSEKGRGSHGRG